MPPVSYEVRFERKGATIAYLSAIPHQLARLQGEQAVAIAHQIQSLASSKQLEAEMDEIHLTGLNTLLQTIDLQVLPSGSLRFVFRDPAIAAWLDFILISPLPIPSSVAPLSPKDLIGCDQRFFAIHHAHARCCSLLRLARSENCWQDDQRSDTSISEIAVPQPISWLNSSDQLWTTLPAEQQLIRQLFITLDFLDESSCSAQTALKLADQLSQRFFQVHQTMPLFGDIQTLPRDRLNAHLGLIKATQRLLYHLLETCLHIQPASEL